MAIKGLSEVRRLPRIGKIRLGIKQAANSGAQYPKAVDYFVVNEDPSTPASAAKAFHEVYGAQPKEIDIMFPVEDREKFFTQFYRRYGKGTGLLCKGDGETAMEIDKDTGEMKEIECCSEECEWAQKKHCRPVGTLQFLLYKVPGLGIWQIDTSSFHSIVNLNSAIDFITGLTGGRISWIPLKLVIRPKEVQVEGKKKTVYVLDLASDQVRLEDILAASRKKPAEFLMPDLDMDKAPDDLYAKNLIEPSKEEEQPKTVRPEEDPAWQAEQQRLLEEENAEKIVKLHQLLDELKVPDKTRNQVINSPTFNIDKAIAECEAKVERKRTAQSEQAAAKDPKVQEDKKEAQAGHKEASTAQEKQDKIKQQTRQIGAQNRLGKSCF